ncbi:MAG: hypothetical protein ACHBN1_10505 [Heteroscytonema crispum UTEX LB 1556]
MRFWAVFALGKLATDQALPKLERLAAFDKEILPGRWAADFLAFSDIELRL